jgi:hypothetical protein
VTCKHTKILAGIYRREGSCNFFPFSGAFNSAISDFSAKQQPVFYVDLRLRVAFYKKSCLIRQDKITPIMDSVNEDLQDELEKANIERQAIVKKYLLGRKAENLINQWVRQEFHGDFVR